MKIVSRNDQTTKALNKKIQELETTIANLQKGENESSELLKNFNIVSKNTNTLYTVNDFDIHCRFTYVSPSVKKMSGYEPEELLGKSCFDFMHPEDKKNIVLPLLKAYIGYKVKNILKGDLKNQSKTYIYRLKDKDGNWRYAETTSSFIGNNLLNTTNDITETKIAKEKQLESEHKFKDLVEKSNIAIFIEDNDGNYNYFNESFHKLFGYTADEIKKTSNSDLIHPDDYKRVMGYHNKRINGKKAPSDYEHRAIKKDGSTIYLSLSVVPIVEDTKIVGTHSYIWDITERKQIQEQLTVNENKLIYAQKLAKMGHYNLLLKAGMWTSSNGLDNIFGIDKNFKRDLKGSLQIIHPDFKEIVASYFRSQIINKQPNFDKELKIVNFKTKEEIWIHGLGTFKLDKNDRVIEIFGTITDITERKSAEIALRESEKKFRDMANLLPQGIFEYDLKGNLNFINEKGLELYDYTIKDFEKGINIFNTIAPKDKERAMNNAERVLSGEQPGDHNYTALRKDGSEFPVLIYTSLMSKNDEQLGARGVVIDNTERTEAEKKIQSRTKELELWHEVTVGRELKMIELKKEINNILERFGEKPKYKIIG